MMSSCQIGPSQNKAKFGNVENLLKLTVDKFCEKSHNFLSNRIVVLDELKFKFYRTLSKLPTYGEIE